MMAFVYYKKIIDFLYNCKKIENEALHDYMPKNHKNVKITQ